MTTSSQAEIMVLLRKLEAVIDAEKTSKQVASIAACTLLVSIAERLNPDECAIFADMILDMEREVRHGHNVIGSTH